MTLREELTTSVLRHVRIDLSSPLENLLGSSLRGGKTSDGWRFR
jgi:hypothetical protein